MSESILLLNPRRRARRHNRRRKGRMPAALRRYWAMHGRKTNRRAARRRRHHHVSRRRRINRRSAVGAAPRRRARRSLRGRRRGSVRRAVRRQLSGIRRGGPFAIAKQLVIPGAVGAAGALALDVIWGYLSPKLPATVQTGWFSLGVKLALVAGVSYGVDRMRPGMRTQVAAAALGASTIVLYGALKGLAQSTLPSTIPGLSGYIDYQSYALPGARMGGYMARAGLGDLGDFFSPAAVIQPMGTPVPRQFGGYIAHQPGMAGYMAAQPHMGGGGGLMGYDYGDGM
jgi:hypothetical protein